jgi:hypothetical protein
MPQAARRWRRTAAIAATVLALSMVAVPTAFAAPPQHSPSVAPPIEFAAGELCSDPIRFENTALRGKDTVFAPSPDGSERVLSRGYGASVVTDLETGATYSFQGGVQFTFVFSADGSTRVDARGRDFIAWYFPGDDSELGPGAFQVNGHLTEWYATDGTFIRATYSGKATNLCEALAG